MERRKSKSKDCHDDLVLELREIQRQLYGVTWLTTRIDDWMTEHGRTPEAQRITRLSLQPDT